MIRPQCFNPWGQGYAQPTPQEVREFVRAHELSGADVARICGVDGRTPRRWMADQDTPGHRAIPYAAWRLLVLEVDSINRLNLATDS